MSSKRKVAVYVGHGISTDGSKDVGCVYGKYTEAGLMKAITGACVAYLKGSGLHVITDYPANKINMEKQVEQSNRQNVEVHVAFHCDYSKAPSGTLPLYTSGSGRELAKLMNKYVMKEVGIKTRGVGMRTDLYELNCTDMPAVIFECGSIKKDLKKMRKKYDEYGKGAAMGICEYLGVPFTGKKA
jgi:N-acetylmuramoyl-L-alanine amidase